MVAYVVVVVVVVGVKGILVCLSWPTALGRIRHGKLWDAIEEHGERVAGSPKSMIVRRFGFVWRLVHRSGTSSAAVYGGVSLEP